MTLPAPLVAPDVDLTNFPFMQLDVDRLRNSDLALTLSAEAFRAAVLLWCAAWHQKPAASLPDDDRVLAQLAGFGRFVKEWRKVRADALRGFVLCADGRLYHTVVAEKANEAWRRKNGAKDRTAAARAKRAAQAAAAAAAQARTETHNADGDCDIPHTAPVTDAAPTLLHAPAPSVTDAQNHLLQPREGEGERESPLSPPRGRGGRKRDEAGVQRDATEAPKPKLVAARLPSDWAPDNAATAYAKRIGLADWEIAAAAQEFREYWASRADARSRRGDWNLTFKARVRDLAGDPRQRAKLKFLREDADNGGPPDWAMRLDTWRSSGGETWLERWGPRPGEPGYCGPQIEADLFQQPATEAQP